MSALASALTERGHYVLFASKECPPALTSQIASQGVKTMTLSDGGVAELKALSGQHQIGFIVIDGYHLDERYQRDVKAIGLPLMTLDDYGHCQNYCADLILNQNPGAPPDLYLHRAEHCRLLLGTDYVLLRAQFLQAPKRSHLLSAQPEHFLISMGGADLENATELVLQALLKATGKYSSAVTIGLIVGAANSHLQKLQTYASACNDKAKIQIFQNVTDMANLLNSSQVLISAGGTTVFEAAYLALPNLVLQTAANQNAVKEFGKMGAIHYLGDLSKASVPALATAIEACLIPDLLNEFAATAAKIIDGRGNERVIAAMEPLSR